MVFSSLDALKTSSKKKETRAKKEIFKVLHQASYVERDHGDETLDIDLGFVG